MTEIKWQLHHLIIKRYCRSWDIHHICYVYTFLDDETIDKVIEMVKSFFGCKELTDEEFLIRWQEEIINNI